MTDMPPGTIGFEAIGEVEDDDWEEAVEPVLGRKSPQAEKFGCCTSSVPTPATSREMP